MSQYRITLKGIPRLLDTPERTEARRKLRKWCKGDAIYNRAAVARSVFADLPYDIQKHCHIVTIDTINGVI